MTNNEKIGGHDAITVAAWSVDHLFSACQTLRANAAIFRQLDRHAEAAHCEQEAKRMMEPIYVIRRTDGLKDDLARMVTV
jgi:hypothetical protein